MTERRPARYFLCSGAGAARAARVAAVAEGGRDGGAARRAAAARRLPRRHARRQDPPRRAQTQTDARDGKIQVDLLLVIHLSGNSFPRAQTLATETKSSLLLKRNT